ncbi:MAG: methyl-accepting chemotaxis protein, partial [Sulfurimonadaceae bacterium]|nr:methyl-accepting chemotaxis protein [Sulfurimonadaceae bacterium]
PICFAVVAEKIRELAEVSLSNAQTISRVLKSIHDHIDKVTVNAEQSKNVIVSLGESSVQLNERFDDIRQSIDQITEVLDAFRNEFAEETVALDKVREELDLVRNASHQLVSNAENSKEIMNHLVTKGGSLKSLADGFEVVLNKRDEARSIITPPIKAVAKTIEGSKEVWLFDSTSKGISFYSSDMLGEQVKKFSKGTKGSLELSVPLDGVDLIRFEIVALSSESMEGVYFYGAKRID